MKVAQITRACYPLVKGDGRRDQNFTARRKFTRKRPKNGTERGV
ncbi:hypothetical protein P3T33_002983 [Rhizobium sp. AN67]|nr:hypothetical protein [Rhizobium sp. AN67]